MKRNKQKISGFKRLVYLSLAIIFLECIVYFAKTFYSPPVIFAQTNVGVTESTTLTESSASPLINATPTTNPVKLPILIYHYVEIVTDERDTIRKSLNILPNTFQNQIDTLKNNGYTFITPSDIEKIEKGEEKVEKPIIISFDDGYRDFYTDVFPIITKNNIKAVAYIVPGFLDKLNYMYWNQIKEIAQSNLVEIGAHSMHHPSLDRLLDKEANSEILDSKLVLELSLGRQITTFAYPYGHFNQQTVELVKSAGFTSALTTFTGANQNTDDKFTLKRIHPGNSIGQQLIEKLKAN